MQVKSMTPEQLKEAFPQLYNEAYNIGVMQERKRISQWMDHFHENKYLALEGIRSGQDFNNTLESEEKQLKNVLKQHLIEF